MIIDLIKYNDILSLISCGEKISEILQCLDFFQLNDDSNIYFRDRRYYYLEDYDNIVCLKENDLIEFVHMCDVDRIDNLPSFSNIVEVIDEHNLVMQSFFSKGTVFIYSDNLGSKLDNALFKVERFTLKFKYFDANSNISRDLASIYIDRSRPEMSSILLF